MRVRSVILAVVGILFSLLVIGGGVAMALTLSWNAPTKYTDNTSILPADQARIVYTPYTGPTSLGPWTAQPQPAQGATSAPVPEPAPGTTMWYTVDARLDGYPSGKAVPVDKALPFPVTMSPDGLRLD